MDIATQSGWEIVAHDEEMNYYFVKDKANDETDEFYDDETRKERAERYRRRYTYELPLINLTALIIYSVIYFILFLTTGNNPYSIKVLMWIYFALSSFEVLTIWATMRMGNRIYNDLLISRQEWDAHKRYSQKKSFKKIQQLRVFLQEQSEKGFSLTGYKSGYYTFEKDDNRYNYFVDTKTSLKKRLKAQKKNFSYDKKDFFAQGLKWYELSLDDASKYNLKPVAIIGNNIIIYKRPFSDEKIPWDNGNESLTSTQFNPLTVGILIISLFVGFVIGYLLGTYLL